MDIIIGMMFLWEHNPEINWKAGEVKFTWCPHTCPSQQFLTHEEEIQAMNEPQLEDFTQDKYSQLNPEPWGDSDQFVH